MITALYAALLVILYVMLSLSVIQLRFKYRVSLYDGGHKDLENRIRAHGNLAEYAPFFLILLLLCEQMEAPFWMLHALGGVFVVARLLHAKGIAFHKRGNANKFRLIGMVLTLMCLILSGLWLGVGALMEIVM